MGVTCVCAALFAGAMGFYEISRQNPYKNRSQVLAQRVEGGEIGTDGLVRVEGGYSNCVEGVSSMRWRDRIKERYFSECVNDWERYKEYEKDRRGSSIFDFSMASFYALFGVSLIVGNVRYRRTHWR